MVTTMETIINDNINKIIISLENNKNKLKAKKDD